MKYYVYKFDNLGKMDQFCETYPKLTQETQENTF